MLNKRCPECHGRRSIEVEVWNTGGITAPERCPTCGGTGYVTREPNPGDPQQVALLAKALFESSDERKSLPRGELFTLGAMQDPEIRRRFERQAGRILSFLTARVDE